MDTNASLLVLIADLNSQIHALQEENTALRRQLPDGATPEHD